MNQNIKESDISEEKARYLYLKYKGKYFRLKNKLKGNGPTPSSTTPTTSTSMFKSMSGMSTSLFKKKPTPPPPAPAPAPGLVGKLDTFKKNINDKVSAADIQFKDTITSLTDYFTAMKNIEGYNEAIDETFTSYSNKHKNLKTVDGDFKDKTPEQIIDIQETIKENLKIKDSLKKKIEVIQKLHEECETFKQKFDIEKDKIKDNPLISFKQKIDLVCLSPPDETNYAGTIKKIEEEKKKNIIKI